MDFKKFSAASAALAFGIALVACDDSSSGPQNDPVPASSGDIADPQSSSLVDPLSSDAGTTLLDCEFRYLLLVQQVHLERAQHGTFGN